MTSFQMHAWSWLRLILGLLVFIAIGWQLSIHLGLGFPAVNFFSYFTNIANLFAAVVFLLGATQIFMRAQRPLVSTRLRYTSAVNMSIVGVVFTVLLRDVDLGSLLPWINFLLHYVMPIVVVFDWFVVRPARRLSPSDFIVALIFPLLYLGYVLLRGRSTSWYPYPFLNPSKAGGYGAVTLYSLGITMVFLVVGGLLVMLANRRFSPS